MKTNHRKVRLWIACLTLLFIATGIPAGCGPEEPPPNPDEIWLQVHSTAFQEVENIPTKYTCDGDDISPQIGWQEPPAGTQSLVLIVDDLNAPGGVFTHWVVYNMPPTRLELPEAVPTDSRLEDGTLQGRNDFNKIGYGGPCPPSGTHRYYFKLYALDTTLALGPGATKKQVERAMEGHVLVQAQLMGRYARRR